MTRTVTDNATIVRDAYEAFARGDVPAVLAVFDEQIEWNEAEGNPWHPGHPFIGPQQVVDGVFARIAQSYEGFTIQVDRLLTDGDTVVVLGRYRATRSRSTGRPLDAQVAHVWDLRDGKVVRFQQYVDTRQLARVLGI
ncbi:nuclear transport factor 2 family protein [Modestobacter sp. URMC 112]